MMRRLGLALVFGFIFAVLGHTGSAHALMQQWCLGQDNNKNVLPGNACPLVTADDSSGNLEVWVTTQSDVTLEQFGIVLDPVVAGSITAGDISAITIAGGSLFDSDMDAATLDGGPGWELDNNLFAQMNGFGTFDVVFNLTGTDSQQGIAGTGFAAGTAALYFVIAGLDIGDFGTSFGPNCVSSIGCIQAAKISSEQFGFAGGFVSNVPLPGAIWLFLSALMGLAGIRHRRRRQFA